MEKRKVVEECYLVVNGPDLTFLRERRQNYRNFLAALKTEKKFDEPKLLLNEDGRVSLICLLVEKYVRYQDDETWYEVFTAPSSVMATVEEIMPVRDCSWYIGCGLQQECERCTHFEGCTDNQRHDLHRHCVECGGYKRPELPMGDEYDVGNLYCLKVNLLPQMVEDSIRPDLLHDGEKGTQALSCRKGVVRVIYETFENRAEVRGFIKEY